MADDQKKPKLPRVCAGSFIFNNEGKVLLAKSKKWNNKYSVAGGKIEFGENIEQVLKRETKEELGIDIYDLKFFKIVEGINLPNTYSEKEQDDAKHFIFLDYTACAENQAIKIQKEELSFFRWNTLDDWLKLDKDKFAPTIYNTLKELKKHFEKEDYEYKYKRALADYQNLLKQTAIEKQEFAKYANERLISEIIPVYDNLKMSLGHFSEKSPDKWLEGIKYVIKQFKDVLENLGIEEIEAIGKKFDPHTMEALEGKGQRVKKQVRSGYKLNGKVIIPVKVILE